MFITKTTIVPLQQLRRFPSHPIGTIYNILGSYCKLVLTSGMGTASVKQRRKGFKNPDFRMNICNKQRNLYLQCKHYDINIVLNFNKFYMFSLKITLKLFSIILRNIYIFFPILMNEKKSSKRGEFPCLPDILI